MSRAFLNCIKSQSDIRQSSKSSLRAYQTVGPQSDLKPCWHPQQSVWMLCHSDWFSTVFSFSPLSFAECKSLRPFKVYFCFLPWISNRTTSAEQDHYNINTAFKVPFRFRLFQRASSTFLVSNANLDCLSLFILPIKCQDLHWYYHLIQSVPACLTFISTSFTNAKNTADMCLFNLPVIIFTVFWQKYHRYPQRASHLGVQWIWNKAAPLG